MKKQTFGDTLRHLLLSWLLAAALELAFVPASARDMGTLAALEQMQLARVAAVTAVLFLTFWLLSRRFFFAPYQRWGIAAAFLVLMTTALAASFTMAFSLICLLVLTVICIYAILGWNACPRAEVHQDGKEKWYYIGATAVLTALFFWFVSAWGVGRVESYCAPSYDFGIFSQMFYYMKETGLPLTTLERDGLLSHFQVHMSPIYYLLLPFYCLAPFPATLQVLQAGVLASAVIPLWMIGKHHGLTCLQRTVVCALLLLYPAFSGGTGYDIHENCFLTPLLLWMLYGIDKKNIPITAVSAVLTLLVKEDAAVYVGIIALYLLLRSGLHREKWGAVTGAAMLVGAVGYFFAVTGYLAQNGDGVMTYRYDNFLYGDSESLVTVIFAVLMNPMKVLYECVDPEKLKFIGQTMLPLLGLPLLTRRFERYILLIPYVLINLMPDYQYQHNILFQYTFGSTACLIYLAAVNLGDLRQHLYRLGALALALAVSIGCFCAAVLPEGTRYPQYTETYAGYYASVGQVLDKIPEDASVAATTFYTVRLSQRKVLYDILYCSKEHLLECEFVALNVRETTSYRKYATNGQNGLENLVALLKDHGYVLFAEYPGVTEVYRKAQ